MRKTIKIEDLKEEIKMLVNDAIRNYNNGNNDLYEYCYDKAICYKYLIQYMCIDYSKPSYEKEFNNIEQWFTEISNEAINK